MNIKVINNLYADSLKNLSMHKMNNQSISETLKLI
jgi:hypothetical protein